MQKKKYVVLDKKVGQTPLQLLQQWQNQNPEYKDIPLAYAGRLDPMASGRMLVLIGDECKKRKKYLGLDKEYEIQVLFDIGSDTGDVLGLVSQNKDVTPNTNAIQRALKQGLNSELGIHEREYPVFSSKTVNGVPLFYHALSGTLDTIQIPKHLEGIYSLKLISLKELEKEELSKHVREYLDRVPKTDEPSKKLGEDFRIQAVGESWKLVLEDSPNRSYLVAKIKVTCGSGVYMRTLAGRLGKSLNTNALALSINRTRIGKYLSVGRFGFWVRSY